MDNIIPEDDFIKVFSKLARKDSEIIEKATLYEKVVVKDKTKFPEYLCEMQFCSGAYDEISGLEVDDLYYFYESLCQGEDSLYREEEFTESEKKALVEDITNAYEALKSGKKNNNDAASKRLLTKDQFLVWFKQFDADQDGNLSETQASQLLNKMGLKSKSKNKEAIEAIKLLESNKDDLYTADSIYSWYSDLNRVIKSNDTQDQDKSKKDYSTLPTKSSINPKTDSFLSKILESIEDLKPEPENVSFKVNVGQSNPTITNGLKFNLMATKAKDSWKEVNSQNWQLNDDMAIILSIKSQNPSETCQTLKVFLQNIMSFLITLTQNKKELGDMIKCIETFVGIDNQYVLIGISNSSKQFSALINKFAGKIKSFPDEIMNKASVKIDSNIQLSKLFNLIINRNPTNFLNELLESFLSIDVQCDLAVNIIKQLRKSINEEFIDQEDEESNKMRLWKKLGPLYSLLPLSFIRSSDIELNLSNDQFVSYFRSLMKGKEPKRVLQPFQKIFKELGYLVTKEREEIPLFLELFDFLNENCMGNIDINLKFFNHCIKVGAEIQGIGKFYEAIKIASFIGDRYY